MYIEDIRSAISVIYNKDTSFKHCISTSIPYKLNRNFVFISFLIQHSDDSFCL